MAVDELERRAAAGTHDLDCKPRSRALPTRYHILSETNKCILRSTDDASKSSGLDRLMQQSSLVAIDLPVGK
jgi:hypothetical protein